MKKVGIINGLYGYRPDGGKKVIIKRPGDIVVLPADEARRIVMLGVAAYVEPELEPAEAITVEPDNDDKKSVADESRLNAKKLARMNRSDLEKLAANNGIDISKVKTKEGIVALISGEADSGNGEVDSPPSFDAEPPIE